jgi:hypothetical protein
MNSLLRRVSGYALHALVGSALPIATAAAQVPFQGETSPTALPLHREILGSYSWPITTASSRAQAYFDQGARLKYAYGSPRESFREAQRLDPSCAMCWWGEAWSMGPSFNGNGMSASAESTARELVERALSVASEATPVERALIETLRSRYSPSPPTGSRRGRDSAYVSAMAAVYERFPEHSEVAMLYADALMLLEPRRGAWPIEKPSVRLIHEVLESVLARDLGHPGACHAYLHATETTPKVVEAQRCADLLGSSIPGASHINHMPSHTYNRVGRWGDATRANIEAWHTDLRAQRGAGFAIYPSHNLHMLFFSAAMDGQGAVSIQAAKDYEKMDPGDGASFQSLALVRFGRFDEVLELPRSPVSSIHTGLWAFGRGLAHLRLQRPDSARWYLARVDSLAEHVPEDHRLRVHSAAQLLGIVGGILRGEILRSEDRVDEAIQAFQEAIAIEGGLTYDEPEPLPFAVRDYLGALLLELGRAEEATPVYEAALAARPHNGWSLFGLERSLRVQGRFAEADEAKERFDRAWARSEVWLPASRF